MKKRLLIVVLTLAVLAATACRNPADENMGTITISLGVTAAGNARAAAAWPPDTAIKSQLKHEVTLTGPSTLPTIKLGTGETSAQNIRVAPGTWTVTVRAYLDGVLYAKGSNSVVVKAGDSKQVSIDMSQARIVFYWVNEHGELAATANGVTSIHKGDTLDIAADAAGYTVKHWYLNGKDTGFTGDPYVFTGTVTGKHVVGLFVEKGGNLFNTNITITVTQ